MIDKESRKCINQKCGHHVDDHFNSLTYKKRENYTEKTAASDGPSPRRSGAGSAQKLTFRRREKDWLPKHKIGAVKTCLEEN